MSGWGMGWFGGGTQKRKDAPKNAILQLRSTLEMLTKREKHLQNQIDEEDAKARKFVTTNKTAAKAALRKKKQLESTLDQTSAQIMNLEGQISSIETANINKETLDALKNASSALKGIHGGLTIDKVDQTMEDLEEQHAISNEIASALTQGAGANAVDEDDLDEALADLQQQELDNKMLNTGAVPVGDQVHRLPAAATGECKADLRNTRVQQQEEDDEEEELKRLQAEMAM
ncbi:Snf7-domain-containing protein [Myriangium duriaei CBS 260.36]|uniref:Vacuolar-sorting protein SNF7 n=1 Tax=Myriangium duriaei CBS 260.36 TaxID=1168546 RepID=A0A9P4IYT0_9PEZI|nr:Snf7-domain-containing protein [Myriangium duriaei CBS 260.36]